MGAERLGNLGPAHQLVNGEEFEQFRIQLYLAVAGVSVDTVKKVMLLVVVGRKDDKVDDSLKNLVSIMLVNALHVYSGRGFYE